MNKLPEYLRDILASDDRDPRLEQASREFEQQPDQRNLFEQHAEEQSSALKEALETLRESGLPAETNAASSSSILIEVDSTLAGENGHPESVDFEQITLDFLDEPKHPELLGRFGRYEVEKVLGSGGMGVVLKAYDSDLHRVVAIKVLAPHLAHHGTARRRFAREAQAAAAVAHPNIIQIHDVESESKVPYLVMQYVPGESLQRRVDLEGPVSVAECLRISIQIAAGLTAAHEQGLVHRDVKPANILLEERVDRVLLSDFGLARAVDDASLTKTGIVAGTPFYMSPEQAFGSVIDHRSDLFSLGSVMYFMLAGRPPFRASGAMAVLHRICQTQHRPLREINPEVPAELAELIDACLIKDSAERVQSASEVQLRLTELMSALQSGKLTLPFKDAISAADSNKKPARSITQLAGYLLVCSLLLTCGWIALQFGLLTGIIGERSGNENLGAERDVKRLGPLVLAPQATEADDKEASDSAATSSTPPSIAKRQIPPDFDLYQQTLDSIQKPDARSMLPGAATNPQPSGSVALQLSSDSIETLGDLFLEAPSESLTWRELAAGKAIEQGILNLNSELAQLEWMNQASASNEESNAFFGTLDDQEGFELQMQLLDSEITELEKKQ
ncbi:MAG: serine/threonine-protein kinase [Planctomycetota bacterium]